MDVVHQVMILYAASGGFLDDINVDSVRSFEKQFYAYMDDHYPEIGREIRETGDFGKDIEELLIKGINEFKKVGFIDG